MSSFAPTVSESSCFRWSCRQGSGKSLLSDWPASPCLEISSYFVAEHVQYLSDLSESFFSSPEIFIKMPSTASSYKWSVNQFSPPHSLIPSSSESQTICTHLVFVFQPKNACQLLVKSINGKEMWCPNRLFRAKYKWAFKITMIAVY